MTTASDRADQASRDKFAARRRLLADAALSAISERGYARTGLREIADHSPFSHGSLHYYFDDKDDLVALAVWNYKSECSRRYDGIVGTARSGSELATGFAAEMSATLRDEAALHRLWYDLRNQALFSEGFSDTIVRIDGLLQDMVWRIVSRFADLEGREIAVSPQIAYSLFDGLFQNALIRFLRGDASAVDELRDEAPTLLHTALAPTSS